MLHSVTLMCNSPKKVEINQSHAEPKKIFPFNQDFKKNSKLCEWDAFPDFQKYNSNDWTVKVFIETRFDSVYNGKMLYLPWYFCNLDRVETGVSEEGMNSLKTLPKSSNSLRCVKALIFN